MCVQKRSRVNWLAFAGAFLAACTSGTGSGVELTETSAANTNDPSGNATNSESATVSDSNDDMDDSSESGPKLDLGASDEGTAETGGTMGGCDELKAAKANGKLK